VKRLGRAAAAVALSVAAAIGISGCPALLIPGLAVEAAYEAYKYNKSRSESPQPGSGQTQSPLARKRTTRRSHGALYEDAPFFADEVNTSCVDSIRPVSGPF
jgi:hypothetical protein